LLYYLYYHCFNAGLSKETGLLAVQNLAFIFLSGSFSLFENNFAKSVELFKWHPNT